MEVKKRRRMQQLAKEAAKQNTDGGNKLHIQKEKREVVVNLMDCDIGASPKLQPLCRKKGLLSPLSVSRDLDLSKVNKKK